MGLTEYLLKHKLAKSLFLSVAGIYLAGFLSLGCENKTALEKQLASVDRNSHKYSLIFSNGDGCVFADGIKSSYEFSKRKIDKKNIFVFGNPGKCLDSSMYKQFSGAPTRENLTSVLNFFEKTLTDKDEILFYLLYVFLYMPK